MIGYSNFLASHLQILPSKPIENKNYSFFFISIIGRKFEFSETKETKSGIFS